jgi:hypothetical protein
MLKHNLIPLPLSEEYLKSLEEATNANAATISNGFSHQLTHISAEEIPTENTSSTKEMENGEENTSIQDHRATFIESPLHPTEKRKVSPPTPD